MFFFHFRTGLFLGLRFCKKVMLKSSFIACSNTNVPKKQQTQNQQLQQSPLSASVSPTSLRPSHKTAEEKEEQAVSKSPHTTQLQLQQHQQIQSLNYNHNSTQLVSSSATTTSTSTPPRQQLPTSHLASLHHGMDSLKTSFLPNLSIEAGGVPGGTNNNNNSSSNSNLTHYCPMCGQQFERAQHAAEHIQLCHGVAATAGGNMLLSSGSLSTAAAIEQHVCLSCDDKFATAAELDEHYRLLLFIFSKINNFLYAFPFLECFISLQLQPLLPVV